MMCAALAGVASNPPPDPPKYSRTQRLAIILGLSLSAWAPLLSPFFLKGF